jgi:photosystem II stability/assembly factor-like uncharacterized protein
MALTGFNAPVLDRRRYSMRNNIKPLSGASKGFLLGAAAMLALIFSVGAISKNTQNIAGDRNVSFNSIYASSDGNTIFVCDTYNVYRSTDGGNNWTVVLKRHSSEP